MHALRVNETKVTSGNAVIDNLFALKKWEKIENWLSFGTSCGFVTRLLNLRGRIPHVCGFLEF